MRQITKGIEDLERKSASHPRGALAKDQPNKHYGKKEHQLRENKETELFCYYCKSKEYQKTECLKLKKKNQAAPTSEEQPSSSRSQPSSTTVAAVSGSPPIKHKLNLHNELEYVSLIANKSYDLRALIDTRSSISFISLNNFYQFCDSSVESLVESVEHRFRTVGRDPIRILGKLKIDIQLKDLPAKDFQVTLHMVETDIDNLDVLFGTDFLDEQKLTLIRKPVNPANEAFSHLLLQIFVTYRTT